VMNFMFSVASWFRL